MLNKWGFTLTGSLFAILFVFQNCSEVHFEEASELSSVLLGTAELKTIAFDPKRSENRPNIQVTAIVDNSYSMSQIQDQMGKGFENVADQLRGFSGDVSVYSTTQDNTGDKSSLSSPIKLIQTHKGALIPYSTSAESSQKKTTPYQILNQFGLTNSFTPQSTPLVYNALMNDSDFTNFKSQFNQSISLGVNGSNKEQGLCTLLRSLKKQKKNGAYQAIIIATNEDDQTLAQTCLDKEEQDVTHILETTNSSSECTSNDPECVHTYSIEYESKNFKRVRYSERTTNEVTYYTLKASSIDYRVKSSWYRYYSSYKYRVHNHKKVVTYKKILERDGLLFNDTNTTTKTIGTGAGLCSGSNGTSSPAAVPCGDAMINSLGEAHGIVANSCYYHCNNTISSEMSKAGPYSGVGKCSQSMSRACSNDEKTDLGGALGLAAVASCNVSCGDKIENKYDRLTVNSCSGINVNDACTLSELQAQSDKYGVSKSALTCKVYRCNESFHTGQLTSTYNVNACNGVSSNSNANIKIRDCNSADYANILETKGVQSHEMKSCQVNCSQSISSWRHTNQVLVESETHGYQSCSSEEHTLASQNANNKPLDRIVNCQSQIYANAPWACKSYSSTSHRACNTDTAKYTQLVNECLNSNYNFKAGSCKIISNRKGITNDSYRKVVAPKKYVSLVDTSHSQDPVIKTVKERLSENYGNNYFLASFINIPGDNDCKPDGINPAGIKYNKLANELGLEKAKVFSNCMSDYSPALEFVFDLIVREVGKSYKLNLHPEKERVYAVHFENFDGSVIEVPNESYNIDNGILSFVSADVLDNVKSVKIQVISKK